MKRYCFYLPLYLLTLMVIGGCVQDIAGESGPVELYVCTDGDDDYAGTSLAPFASVRRARDEIRRLKDKDPDRDFIVYIRQGRYAFEQTLILGLEDSASQGRSITYRNYPGERPILSAGVEVTGWKPAELTGNIWVAELPIERHNLTLYTGPRRLPRARGKGFAPVREYESWGGPHRDTIEFPPGALKDYDDIENAEIVVRTSAAWAMNILPLLSVDEQRQVAKTWPANYSLGRKRHRPVSPDDMWVENVLAELDSPGEWVVHPDQGKVYYWPIDDGEPVDVIMPAITEIIRIEGDIDYDGPEDKPVRGLRFEGLTLMHADRILPPKDIQGQSLQHGWDYFDSPNALLRFRGAEDCVVKDCHFTASGANGIRLDLHAQNITIENSLFNHLGGSAATFAGYGLGTKDANHSNRFINNHVHDVGQLKWDRPALFIWQSGNNRIANNLFHNTPYTGVVVACRAAFVGEGEGWMHRRDDELPDDVITVATYEGWKSREPYWHGRDNIIESNEFYAVMQVMDDGNAIYVSGTAGGNVVRSNYIHNTWTQNLGSAIRCDDDQHLTLVEKNVVINNAGRAGGIVIKGKNDVINNFFINLYQTAQHHFGMMAFLAYKPDSSTVEHNVIYASGPNVLPVVAGRTRPHIGAEQIKLRHSDFKNNIYWCPADADWAKDYLADARQEGFEKGSKVADPLFDIARNDFSFQPESPALALGIEPLDISSAGLDYSEWATDLAQYSRRAAHSALQKARKAGQKITGQEVSGDDMEVDFFGADG